MFRAILLTQWKWLRWAVLIGAVAAFAIPLAAVRAASTTQMQWWEARALLSSVQQISPLYTMFCLFFGMILGTIPWSIEQAGRHVYALSMPIPRWHYVLLRFCAGAVLALVVAFFQLLGSLIATTSAQIPTGLHAHPFAISARFTLALLLSFALWNALASITKRTGMILAGLTGALVVIDIAAGMMGYPPIISTTLVQLLVVNPGPFKIFVAPWMLISV